MNHADGIVRAARPVDLVRVGRKRIADGDPGAGLAWRLGAAAREQQDASEQREEPDEAHGSDG